MPRRSDLDILVQSLYAAAIEPSGWGDVLTRIAKKLRSDNIHLMAWSPTSAHPAFSLAPGMAEDMEWRYKAYYGVLDPRRIKVSTASPGEWLACHQYFDSRTVSRSEFFQDYLIPGGCRYLLGSRLVRHANHDVFLGMHRAAGSKPYGDRDIQLVRRLTNHMQQAARIWLETESLRERASIGIFAINFAEMGVLAVDATGSIAYASAYAEAVLREGTVIKWSGGKITAATMEGAVTLKRALIQASAALQGQSLRLDSSNSAIPESCQVVITPLSADTPLGKSFHPAPLLIMFRHSKHTRVASVDQLVSMYGLTIAEAWVARAVGAGKTLEECASDNGVAVNTIKRQLQNIFIKTGVKRQTELARAVGRIPVLRNSKL